MKTLINLFLGLFGVLFANAYQGPLIMTVIPGQTGECCRTVQRSLASIAGDNDFSDKIENPGTLAGLMSGRNRTGFAQVPLQDPQGRTRIVQVRYIQKLNETAADSRSGICDAGDTESERFANVETSYYREVKLTLDDGEFQEFCATQSTFREEMTVKKLNVLYSGINTDMVTEMAGLKGNFYGGAGAGNGPLSIPMINTDGTAQYWGETEILDSFEDIEVSARPLLAGTGNLRKYTRLLNIGCCNDGGQDINKAGAFDYYRDSQVDSIIAGDNNILAWSPGAAQMFWNNRYVGQFQKFDAQNAKTTIIDPRFGISLDMTVYYNWCEDDNTRSQWIITWGVDFGLFVLPSDLAAVGNNWTGVNNILHFQATCGDVDVCS